MIMHLVIFFMTADILLALKILFCQVEWELGILSGDPSVGLVLSFC